MFSRKFKTSSIGCVRALLELAKLLSRYWISGDRVSSEKADISSMGDATREEHSEPDRRSSHGASRLLRIASSAGDILRGFGLGILASMAVGYDWRVCLVRLVFDGCWLV
jgi:hypothetical protein